MIGQGGNEVMLNIAPSDIKQGGVVMNVSTLNIFINLPEQKQEQLIALMIKILAYHQLDSGQTH